MGSSTASTTAALQQLADKVDISKDYFISILNGQLIIFSVIVGALVALYFLFNWRISKKQVKDEVEAEIKKLREEVLAESRKALEERSKEFTRSIETHSREITFVRASVYRTLGEFWDSQKNFSVAFLWWMRAANNFSKSDEDGLTRIALGSAKESVERIENSYELDSNSIGEFQRIMGKIDKKKFKIEKELLDKALKDILTKKKV